MWLVGLIVILLAAGYCYKSWQQSGLSWRDQATLAGMRLYTKLWHRWTCNQMAPWPLQGPALVIANHTCSADAAFLMAGCGRTTSFLVAGEFYYGNALLHRILDHLGCVAIKRNGQDAVGLRRALRRLQEGRVVCLFPEGNLSGVARGLPRRPKLGIALLALHTRLPVFPVHIAGGPQTDQLLASWLWPARVPVHVHFGPPIDLSAYYARPRSRRLYEEVADLLMRQVRELGTTEA